jgi:predicted TIM-barrel fold metal-dependent hydrolase
VTRPFDPAPLLDGLRVTVDIDVLLGSYPGQGVPRRAAVTGPVTGAVAHLRAALFDMVSGNDEILSGVDGVPVGALDLRDPVGAACEIERLAGLGVRAVRLFPDEQGVQPGFPSVRHVARVATEAGLAILTGGDVRLFWRPFSGLDARVVFLDTHFYHLGDFLLTAADEPGFHTSTRLLTSPDALETVAQHLGAQRLVFGSRAPYYEPLVPMLRLATSTLTPAEKELVAGGNAHRLLGVNP